jgi:hypothetical protein
MFSYLLAGMVTSMNDMPIAWWVHCFDFLLLLLLPLLFYWLIHLFASRLFVYIDSSAIEENSRP